MRSSQSLLVSSRLALLSAGSALACGLASPALAQGACPEPAEVESLALATPASDGLPALRMGGAPTLGAPFQLEVARAFAPAAAATPFPGSVGLIAVSAAADPVFLSRFGATIVPAAPFSVRPFRMGPDGTSGPLAVLAAVPASLCGRTFYTQAVFRDAGAQGGLAFTRAARIRFGPGASRELFPGRTFGVELDPWDVATGDFDGNGIRDLATIGYRHDSLTILLGRGDGTYEEARSLPSGGRLALVVEDFDGDLRDDIAALGSGLEIWLGNGDGTFAPPMLLAVGGNDLASGDLDGDGTPDLVALDGNPRFLLGLGDGTFAQATIVRPPSELQCVAVGDLDGDGKDDLVGCAPNEVYAMRRVIGGAFLLTSSTPISGTWRDLALADLDLDGELDLALAAVSEIRTLFGTGTGDFDPSLVVLPVTQPRAIAAGDVSGDGLPDLVAISRQAPGNTVVLEGLGGGAFAAARTVLRSAGSGMTALTIDDLDGDAVGDVAIATRESVAVLLADGQGAFDVAASYDGFRSPESIAIGDVNGNQIADLVVLSVDERELSLAYGRGDGTLGARQNLPLGIHPRFPGVGDLDQDGFDDIVLLENSSQGSRVRILSSRGNRTFDPPAFVPVDGASGLVLADANGDRLLDLLVAVSPYAADNGVQVHLGLGDGSFAAPALAPTDLGPSRIALGDFDADGFVDLAVACVNNKISIVPGLGDGTFQPATTLETPSGLADVAVGDLNGDARLDVVSASVNRTGAVSVFLGSGNGTFAPRADTACGFPRRLAIADVDRDLVPDLLLAQGYGSRLSLLTGAGDGTWSTCRDFVSGAFAFDLAVADLDGDLLPDVAVANTDSDEVTIFLDRALR